MGHTYTCTYFQPPMEKTIIFGSFKQDPQAGEVTLCCRLRSVIIKLFVLGIHSLDAVLVDFITLAKTFLLITFSVRKWLWFRQNLLISL